VNGIDKETKMKTYKTRTSEDVRELGLYSSECCGEELVFEVDDTFTRCPKCEGLCLWELEANLVRPEELEAETRIAA
jgi:hypothetical protein